jgi:tetratricopeptide (TPR) repeat protein
VSLKRKKQKARAKAALATPARLRLQAEQALENGRFREAIGHFKSLSKTEPGEVWEQGLATAYRGRALELEAKGMDKEAFAIWENRARSFPSLPPDPHCIALQLRLGKTAPALEGYRRLLGDPGSAAATEARARLAALYLAGYKGLEGLPADDPVVRDYKPAAAALEAYCRGADDDASRHLKAVPFRSPYRDLVTVLKALLALAEDPVGSARLLGRVGEDSAFAPLAAAARLALLPEEELPQALIKADEPTRAFAAVLCGWSEERLGLWNEYRRLGAAPGTAQLMRLLDRHRGRLGDAWVRRQALLLAYAEYPRPLPRSVFAELSRLLRLLEAAWLMEDNGDADDIFDAWLEVIEELMPDGGPRPHPGSDKALRIALIQRRMAAELNLLKRGLDEEVEEQLEQSLELDPDYRPGYILLIGHYRAEQRLKDARRVLAKALERWPEEVDLLNEALDTALAGEAFKKAAGLARKILARDPINRRAKESLYRAHLAHARKQFLKGRSDLADKELKLAAEWAGGPERLARLDLLLGISRISGRGVDRELLSAACERLGGGLVGRLAFALEVERLQFSPSRLLKQAGLLPLPKPERADLLAFCRLLREVVDSEGWKPYSALDPFRKVLEKATGLKLSRQESETVCETLRMIGAGELRLAYAKAALERWPHDPLFVLHRFEAEQQAFVRRRHLPRADFEYLEEALDRARASGDNRTSHRLVELLKRNAPLPRFGDVDLPPESEAQAMLEAFEEFIDSELLDSDLLDPEMLELREQLGPETFKALLVAMLKAGKLPPPFEGLDEDDLPRRAPRNPRRAKGR